MMLNIQFLRKDGEKSERRTVELDSGSQKSLLRRDVAEKILRECCSVKLAGEVTVLVDCNEKPFKPDYEMLVVVTGWTTGVAPKKLREGVVQFSVVEALDGGALIGRDGLVHLMDEPPLIEMPSEVERRGAREQNRQLYLALAEDPLHSEGARARCRRASVTREAG